MKRNIQLTILLSILVLSSSCTKWIEPPASKNQITNISVFADSTVATSALLGIYYSLGTHAGSSYVNFKYLNLYTDEGSYTGANIDILQFNQGKLLPPNSYNSALWNTLYNTIYQCNNFIEGIRQSTAIKEELKLKLQAEALFLRAFSYFYLVNCYEKLPLLLTADINLIRVARQVDSKTVYLQILEDLTNAKNNLNNNYTGSGRVRANVHVVNALLARVYLYLGQWNNAQLAATEVINQSVYTLVKVDDIFLANSTEAILQFWCTNGVIPDAASILPASTTVLPTYTINYEIIQSFSLYDSRKDRWISTNNVTTAGLTKPYYILTKYKNRVANAAKPEFVMALRLAEQFLIRAEAYAQQEQLFLAAADLNKVRNRAGLSNLPIQNTKEELLLNIEYERKIELLGEWGHRFFDLKRTHRLDQIIGTLKPTWESSVSKTLPIPLTEIMYNPQLTQNYGY